MSKLCLCLFWSKIPTMVDTANVTDSRLPSEINLRMCLGGFVYTGVAEEARHIRNLSCSISLACSLDWMKRKKWRKGAPAASSSSHHYPLPWWTVPWHREPNQIFSSSIWLCQTFYQEKETSTLSVWVTVESSWRSEKGQNTVLQPVYLLFIYYFIFGAFMVCVCASVCIHVSTRMLQHICGGQRTVQGCKFSPSIWGSNANGQPSAASIEPSRRPHSSFNSHTFLALILTSLSECYRPWVHSCPLPPSPIQCLASVTSVANFFQLRSESRCEIFGPVPSPGLLFLIDRSFICS